MSFIKDMMERARERKRKQSDYEDDDRIVSSIRQKKLSHNERELAKDLEEEKQKYIKEALHWENKKRQIEDKRKATTMLKYDKSMFDNPNILMEKRNFLRGGDF